MTLAHHLDRLKCGEADEVTFLAIAHTSGGRLSHSHHGDGSTSRRMLNFHGHVQASMQCFAKADVSESDLSRSTHTIGCAQEGYQT